MTPDLDRVSVPEVSSVDGVPSLSTTLFPMDGGSSPFRACAIVQCHSVEDMERFIASRDSLPPHLRGFIVPYSQEEYATKGARLFLTVDGRGGVALMNGELGSLFSLPGAHYGDILVAFAVEHGASRLSCYDTRDKLPSLYGRHGFTESLRAPWNDEYAPRTWNYAVWGRPDYVEMSR